MPPHVLTEDHAAFLEAPISVTVASRDARRVPSVVRASACRVSADRRRVTLLLPTRQARQVLADIAATGAIAVVCSQPSTHRTLQFKGSDARPEALRPDDPGLVAAHTQGFTEELLPLGYTRDLALTVHDVPGGELSAVSFSVDAVFDQTPGPRASARVDA